MCKSELVISFFGPLRSETNRVLLFRTRDLLPELTLFFGAFFRPFLSHFWDPLTGRIPFVSTQITVCIVFLGSRFWTRFGAVFGTNFGWQIRIRNWQF